MLRSLVVAITLLGGIALAGPVDRAAAQDRRVPASPADIRLSYAPIVQRVQPAVVNVYAAKMVQNRNPLLDDPIFRRFFGVPGQQPEQMQRSLGSGVMGNPFGVGQTVTHGIISALARTQVGISDYQFFIQTDAAINPGNSGGALVDLSGRLVGINTAIFSRSGGSQGIGFAIPANMAKVVVASAKSGGSTVKRPWLGARLQAVTPEIADGLGLKRPSGALIASVTPTSPAARAGLKTSDLIIAIDGQPVEDANAFDYRFATKPIGGSARLGIVRGGRELALNVALEAAPDTPHEELVIASPSPFQGAKVSNLSPALADRLRLDPSAQGVVIVEIANGSSAQSLGFQPGDLVLSVNNARIAKTRDLERVAGQSTRRWSITIVRAGQQLSVELRG